MTTAYAPATGTATPDISDRAARLLGLIANLPSAAALADATANPTTSQVAAEQMLWNTATWDRAKGASAGDNLAGLGVPIAASYGFDGTNFVRNRAVKRVDQTSANAAGDTLVLTPTAGKKFRLLGYALTLTGDATQAGAGQMVINFRDAASAIFGTRLYIPSAAANVFGGFTTGFINLGNGYLSGAANNSLNINLGAALTGGALHVLTVCAEE